MAEVRRIPSGEPDIQITLRWHEAADLYALVRETDCLYSLYMALGTAIKGD